MRAESIAGGEAMVFTTTGDVAELRRRVARMAEMHNKRSDMGMKRSSMAMPPAQANIEEIDEGARLTYRPQDQADLEILRQQVQQHVQKMSSGQCPMMQGRGRGQPQPPTS